MSEGAQERVIGVLPSAEELQAAVEGWRRNPTATATDVAREPAAPTGAYMEPESKGAAAGGLIGSLFYLGAGLAAGGIILAGGSLGLPWQVSLQPGEREDCSGRCWPTASTTSMPAPSMVSLNTAGWCSGSSPEPRTSGISPRPNSMRPAREVLAQTGR